MNFAWDYRGGTAVDDPGVVIDAAFPGAAGFADPDQIGSPLAPAMGLDPVAVAVEIMNVSYVPARELGVVYRFTPAGATGETIRTGRLRPAGHRAGDVRAGPPACG